MAEEAFEFDASDVMQKLDTLEKRSPVVFQKQTSKFLYIGSAKIKSESTKIASREAKGVTSHYMQGFQISPIFRDSDGNLAIKIYNMELYSMVIEYGGHWSKMPPRQALDKWIQKMFSPRTDAEAKSIAFAVAVAIKKNRQEFRQSKAKKKHMVMTMNRAVDRSDRFLNELLVSVTDEGLRML